MSALNGKSILILATNGFEQSELEVPPDQAERGRCHCARRVSGKWRNRRLG